MIYPKTFFNIKEDIPELPMNIDKTDDYVILSFILAHYSHKDLIVQYNHGILTIKTIDNYIGEPVDPKYTRKYPLKQPFHFNFKLPNIDNIVPLYYQSILTLKCHIGKTTNLDIIAVSNTLEIENEVENIELPTDEFNLSVS